MIVTAAPKQQIVINFLIAHYRNRAIDALAQADCVLGLDVSPRTVQRAVKALREAGLVNAGRLTGRQWISPTEVAAAATALDAGYGIGVEHDRLIDYLAEMYLCDRRVVYQAVKWAEQAGAVRFRGNTGWGLVCAA